MKQVSPLRMARLLGGFSLDDIKKETGLDIGLLSRAERGLYQLTPKQKKGIATALGLPLAVIFPEDSDVD